MKNLKKGFTLVELMVVIVIIGILAALAIPRFLGATNKTKAAEFKPVLKQVYTLQTAYRQERDIFADSLNIIAFDQPDTNASRFVYTSGVSGGAPSNGFLASAAVKAAGLIKGADGTDLNGSKACVDTSSVQVAAAGLASIANIDASANCP